MNLDDAFRNIMNQSPATPVVMEAPVPPPVFVQNPVPVLEKATQILPKAVEEPEETEEKTILPSTEPEEEEDDSVSILDLSRVIRVERFQYSGVEDRSQIAEEYRILRTRLQIINPDRNSVMLTSCRHGEGKTSTSINLAMTMARHKDQKILLIDLDLRRPRVSRNLGIKVKNGVVEAVLGKCDPEESIVFSAKENLYVMPTRREYTQATEVLESDAMQEMMDRLHKTFDFILVDTCPCLSTADPMIVGPLTGGAIMVVRSRQTQRESVAHAVTALREHNIPTLGMILTFMKYFIPRYFYRYQYYHDAYYYYQYGADKDKDKDR